METINNNLLKIARENPSVDSSILLERYSEVSINITACGYDMIGFKDTDAVPHNKIEEIQQLLKELIDYRGRSYEK